jgi:hypothetical protein
MTTPPRGTHGRPGHKHRTVDRSIEDMAAPILLKSVTGESCKPRIDLVQQNIRRAPTAENHPHGVNVVAVALPTAAPTSLSQHETSIGAPIGAPDHRPQKDNLRPGSARLHRRRHTSRNANRPHCRMDTSRPQH